MRLIRKSSWFRRPEIEMTKEEYEAYKFGRFYGNIDGMIIGIAFSTIVMLLLKIFGL